jgi:hypothetical protein
MPCNIPVANGKDSLLFASLVQSLGETRARDYYYHYLSNASKFDSLEKDSNGEPQFKAYADKTGLSKPRVVSPKTFSGFSPAAQDQIQLLVQQWSWGNKPLINKYGSFGIAVPFSAAKNMYAQYKDNPAAEQYNKLNLRYDKMLNMLVIQEIKPAEIHVQEDNATVPINTPGTQVLNTDQGKTYKGQVLALAPNQVFVFGANDRGLHGAGAAAQAMWGRDDSGNLLQKREDWLMTIPKGEKGIWTTLGEHSKISEGRYGKSYGLVTVEGKLGSKNEKNRIPLDKLTTNIAEFYKTAMENPDKQFLVAYTDNNSGKKNLNGYSPLELATLFDGMPIPENVVFEESFNGLMQNTTRRRVATGEFIFEEQGDRESRAIKQEMLARQQRILTAPILDANGKETGNFFSGEQMESIGSMFKAAFSNYIINKGNINEAYSAILKNWQAQHLRNQEYLETGHSMVALAGGAEKVQEMNNNLKMVIDSYPRLYAKIKSDLYDYYHIDLKRINQQRNTVTQTEDKALLDADGNIIESESDAVSNEDTTRDLFGKMAELIDPRDTMTGRLKLWLSTIPAMEYGTEEAPASRKIPISNSALRKLIGTATGPTTITRTPEQAKEIKLTPTTTRTATTQLSYTAEDGTEQSKMMRVSATGVMTAEQAEDYNNSRLGSMQVDSQGNQILSKAGDIMYKFEPYVQDTHALISKKGWAGQTEVANVDQLFQRVLETVHMVEPNLHSVLAKLREAGKDNATLMSLAQKLEKAAPHYQNEFISIVRKQNQQFQLVFLRHSKRSDGTSVVETRVFNSNRGSAKELVINQWRQQQKVAGTETPLIYRNAANQFMVDTAVASAFRDQMADILAKWDATVNKDEPSVIAAATTDATNFVNNLLQSNGIIFTDEMLNELVNNISAYSSTRIYGANIFDHMRFNKEGQPLGLLSIIISKLTGATQDELDTMGNPDDVDVSLRNFLYSDKDATGILANIFLKYKDSVSTQSFRNVNGDIVYAYGHPTYLSDEFNKIKSDPAYYATLQSLPFSKNNFLLVNMAPGSKVELQYVDGFNLMGKNAGTERTAMSPREQEIDAVNRALRNKDVGDFYSLTHSDKTRTPLFTNIPRMKGTRTQSSINITGDKATFTDVVGEGPINQLAQLFFNEYNRIKAGYQKEGQYNHEKYEQGNKTFYLTPFNASDLKALVAKGVITAEDYAIFYNDVDGSPTEIFTGTTNNMALIQGPVMKVMTHFANQLVDVQIAHWKKTGFINVNTKWGQTTSRALLNETYVKELLKEAGITANMTGKKLTDYNVTVGDVQATASVQEVNDWVIRKAATDFAMNTYFVNAGAAQTLYGDPAQFFKSNLAATLIEYQKRLAGPIAPHRTSAMETDSDGKAVNNTFKAITIADVKIGLSDVANPAYSKGIDIADAQEWVTMKEVLYTMFREGQITQEEYNKGISIIESSPDYYAFDKALEGKIFGVTKPVYYGNTDVVQGDAMFKQYIKSSAMPLYPPLYNGSELNKLRVWMEKNNVARAHMASARKAGNGSPVNVINDDGTVSTDHLDVNKHTIEYKRSGLGIQQDNPYNEKKKEIAIVSQENKLITSTLADSVTPYTAANTTQRSASDIREYREQVRIEMLTRKMAHYNEEMGIVDGEIVDKKKAYDRLIAMAKADGMYPDELLLIHPDKNGDPYIHPFFSPSPKKFESLILSALRKTTQIKISGKSYIQASAAGLRQIKEESEIAGTKGIVWVDENNKNLSFVTKGEGKTNTARILVPFSFFADNKLDINNYMVDGKLDLSKIPQDVLQMVGARIPNQGHNSMLPMEIAGFLPKEMGDVMIVPNGITKQMGSDFDVDKLYVYQRPYKVDKDGVVSAAMPEAGADTASMTDAELSHEYFDIHWSVLTHPDMYEKLTNPLDKPDLADESAEYGQIDRAPFFSAVRQNSDFLLQVDAKALVGLSSLATTFNAVIQNKTLTLGHINPETMVEVIDPIIMHDENGNEQSYERLSGNAYSTYKGQLRTKHDNITTMQSAFLDNAKDPHAGKLNITLNTWPAAYAIVQLETNHQRTTTGDVVAQDRAMDLRYVTRMMTQDIIREYNARLVISNDNLSEYAENKEESVTKELDDALLNRLLKAGMTDTEIEQALKNIKFNPESLDAMTHTGAGMQRNIEQLAVLRKFDQFRRVGKKLIELTSLFNQDTQGAGPSIVTALDKMSKFDRIMAEDYVLHTQDIMHFNGRVTEQGHLFQSIIDNSIHALNLMFPQANMASLFNSIRLETGKDKLSIKQQEEIIRGMRAFVFSNTKMDMLGSDINSERVRLLHSTVQGPSLASRLLKFQQTEGGQKNYLIQRLLPEFTAAAGDYVTYQATSALSTDDINNKRAWTDLLTSIDKETRLLGEDLIRYAFITGGVQDNNSFVKYVPTAYIQSIGMANYLNSMHGHVSASLNADGSITEAKDTQLALTLDSHTFKTQYFQHFPERTVKITDDFKEFGGKDPGPRFRLEVAPNDNTGHLYVVENGTILPAQFIQIRREGSIALYMRTESTPDGVGYTQIDTLGNKKMYEFDSNTIGIARSVIPENRAGIRVQSVIQQHTAEPLVPEAPVDPNELPTHLKAIGINSRTMSYTDTLNMLHNWSTNTDLSVRNQTVAGFLHSIATSQLGSALSSEFLVAHNSPYLSIVPGEETDAGGMATFRRTNTDRISRSQILFAEKSTKTSQVVAATILHEFTHELSARTIQAYDEQTTKPLWKQIVATRPHMAVAMSNYMNVYNEAFNQFNKAKAELKSKLSADDYHNIEYAFSNAKEFITQVMSQPSVANWLNSIPDTKTRSLWTKIVDAIMKLVHSLGNAMTNGQFDENSMLASALKAAIPVMEYQDIHGQFVPTTEHQVKIGTQNFILVTDPQGNPTQAFEIIEGVARQLDKFDHVVDEWRKKDLEDWWESQDVQPIEPPEDTIDSKYELSLGVFMNAEQRTATDKMSNFLNNAERVGGQKEFVLSGAAGTGKTTVLKKILAPYLAAGKDIALLAPSHNARIELDLATEGAGYSSPVTVQSSLRMVPDAAESRKQGKEVFKQRPLRSDETPYLSNKDIIVIDEASMLDDELVASIKAEAHPDAIIIYTGDYAQLNPVGQATLAHPFKTQMEGATLVQNMRAKQQDIVRIVDQVRKFIDTNVNQYQVLTGRMNSENVYYVTTPAAVIDSYVNNFKSKDPNDIFSSVVIAYRNITKDSINTQIRQRLFGNNLNILMPGEYIRINKVPYKFGQVEMRGKKGDITMQNNERLIVNSYNQDGGIKNTALVLPRRTVYIDMPVYEVNVQRRISGSEYESMTTFPINREVAEQFIADSNGIYNAATKKMDIGKSNNTIMRQLTKELGPSVSYGEFLMIKDQILQRHLSFDYAYGASSHNVQGSSYKHVYVVEDDISAVAGVAGAAGSLRSMYVAVSRARESLTILSAAHNQNVGTVTSNNQLAATIVDSSQAKQMVQDNSQAVIREDRGEFSVVEENLLAPDSTDAKQNLLDGQVKRLQALRNTLSAQVTDAVGVNVKARGEAKARIQTLDVQIQTLQTQRTLNSMLDAAKEQLAWVEHTLKRADLDPKLVMAAYNMEKAWVNLSELMEPLDQVDKRGIDESDIAMITDKAIKLNSQITNSTFVHMFTAATGLKVTDITDVVDEGAFGANVRSLNSAKSRFGQVMGKMLMTAADIVDDDTIRDAHKLNILDTQMTNWGKKNNMSVEQVKETFLRRTPHSMGVVNEFSTHWYAAISSFRNTRDKAVQNIINNFDKGLITVAQRKASMADAYNRYWRDMKSIGYTVDNRNIVDVTTGQIRPGTAYDEELAKATAAYGKDAKVIVDQAVKRFEKFLQEQNEFTTSIDALFELKKDEIRSKHLSAEEEAIAIKNAELNYRNLEIDRWNASNSPLTFLSQLNAEHPVLNRGDRYVTSIPNRTTHKQYYDDGYDKIMANPELAAMHQQITSTITKYLSYLPYDVTKKLAPNFFPLIPQTMMHDGMNIKGRVKDHMNKFVADVSATETEIRSRKDGNTDLQTMYLHAKQDDLPGMSGDITRVLETFGRMANHFRQFSRVKELFEIGESILNETNRKRAEGISEGQQIKWLKDAIQYTKEHLMYRRAKQLEGDLGIRIFDTNTNAWNIIKYSKEQLASKAAWDALTVEKHKLDKSYKDGNISKAEYDTQAETLNKRIDDMAKSSRVVYASKIGDKLIAINQAKAISYNPFSAIANWSFGLVSAINYAQGAKGLKGNADYNSKTFWKAFGMVTPAIRNFINKTDSKAAMKIYNLMENFGIMGDVVDSQYGETALSSRRNALHENLKPFAMMRSSDYNVRASVMVATMLYRTMTVRDIATDQMVTIPLWEAFGEDGRIDTARYDAKGWQEEDAQDREHANKFKERVKKIMYTVLGNTDKNASKMIRKTAIGRLVTQFKLSWLPESMMSRFQDERYDPDLERTIKGRWREIPDMGIKTYSTILMRILMAKLAGSEAKYDDLSMENGKAIEDFNMENMYRNFSGMVWSLGIAMTVAMLKNLATGDDGEKDEGMMLLYNIGNRLYQDMFYYESAEIMGNFTGKIIPAIAVIADYQRAMSATYKYITDEDYGLDEMALKWTKAGFPIAQAGLINKVKFMATRDITTMTR